MGSSVVVCQPGSRPSPCSHRGGHCSMFGEGGPRVFLEEASMSTLQIDLDEQTLKRLRQISRREKRALGDVAAHLLADAVRAVRLRPADDAAEAELLRQINTGL